MEPSSALVPFPLLVEPVESMYHPCTIPYRFPSDDPRKPTATELEWIEVFRRSIPSFRKRAEEEDSFADAPEKAKKFEQRYTEILDDLIADPESHGGPPDGILLCRLREQILKELGFRDIFRKVKLAEMYAKDGISFLACSENLLPRPWIIDDLDTFIIKWSTKSWTKAVIFVDNSGADIILGILPFARALLRHGTQVVLAANDVPSINDITYHELVEIIPKLKDKNGRILGVDASGLLVANSGNDLPVIDLSVVSPELAYLASDADLVIMEGMVR